MRLKISHLLFICLSPMLLFSNSLSEFKESLTRKPQVQTSSEAFQLNEEMNDLRTQLREMNQKSEKLYQNGIEKEEAFASLLTTVQQLKEELKEKELAFKTLMAEKPEEEPYALMHEKEISLERLITDYASSNFLYIIPMEMSKIQLTLCSSLAIPKASWEEIIEVICLQNGIGIKKVNAFVKSLYWTMGNHSNPLKHIVSRACELELLEAHESVCFVLNLNGSETTQVHQFLKRFVNERVTSLHRVGNDILLLGEASEVKELIKLVEFIQINQKERSYKLVTMDKMALEEVQAIVSACFNETKGESAVKNFQTSPTLLVLPIKESFLLMGSQKDLEKASQILEDISSQLASPDQMSLYGYSCRHSDPQDLAQILQQVYQVMSTGIALEEGESPKPFQEPSPCNLREGTIPPTCVIPNLVVNPKSPPPPSEMNAGPTFPNFIVDGKSGLIVMVVKQIYLEQLKALAKKLDVPKKMVEIEILLFEKKIIDQTQFGLNLLKLGDNVTKNDAHMKWSVSTKNRTAPGILDYFFSRKNTQNALPALSFAYNFLVSQEDICVHSNPTITTVNQTQAVIDLVEELSINMGTVEDPRTSVISNTFVRAQYGIIIQITPTIHFGNIDNDFQHSITLETDIIFDTTTSDKNNRPDVSRRHIQNLVRIPNGETLILGGLRRKSSETNVDKIPFIGDIPGLGKLFSFTTLDDKSTEMFVLITPHIVEDSMYDTESYKAIDLRKRPGDSPEFLKKLLEAKGYEKEHQYKSTFQKVFSYGNS